MTTNKPKWMNSIRQIIYTSLDFTNDAGDWRKLKYEPGVFDCRNITATSLFRMLGDA